MIDLTDEQRADLGGLDAAEKKHALKHKLVEAGMNADQIRAHHVAWIDAQPKPPTTDETIAALARIKRAREWWPDAELQLIDNTRELLPEGARWRGQIRTSNPAKLADVVAFLVSSATMLTANWIGSELTYADCDDEKQAQLVLTVYWST